MGAEAGLFLPQLRMDFPTIEARVRLADEVGFHSVWFMDHLTPPAGPGYDCFEAWTVAAALARATETIHLGHLVLCDAFRHPALLAKMAATLDVITEGRVELGIGWGSVADEIRGLGLTTAVLTNGTDTIRVEVETQGIACRVDHVFNSAEIGHAKPDARVFTHVLGALGLTGPEVFFTDDSPPKLAGAVEVGMHTHAFVGRDDLRQELVRLGVLAAGT